jgi:hypothetical protein
MAAIAATQGYNDVGAKSLMLQLLFVGNRKLLLQCRNIAHANEAKTIFSTHCNRSPLTRYRHISLVDFVKLQASGSMDDLVASSDSNYDQNACDF